MRQLLYSSGPLSEGFGSEIFLRLRGRDVNSADAANCVPAYHRHLTPFCHTLQLCLPSVPTDASRLEGPLPQQAHTTAREQTQRACTSWRANLRKVAASPAPSDATCSETAAMFRKKKNVGSVTVMEDEPGEFDDLGLADAPAAKAHDPEALDQMSAQQLEALALGSANAGKEATSRALRMANEAREIGANTAATMHKQTEQLEKMSEDIEVVHDYLDKSERTFAVSAHFSGAGSSRAARLTFTANLFWRCLVLLFGAFVCGCLLYAKASLTR